MEIAASIKGASKEYKTGDTVITALQPKSFDFMDRFQKGKINEHDLLTDEIDFQKEQSKFNEKRAELVYKQIELISNSGALSSFIDNLR